MSNPVDSSNTAGGRDPHASASSETLPAPPTGGPSGGFGPAAPGEVGSLGPYRIVKELGKGGMGAVYLAVDTRLNRKLALKVMLPEFAADRAAKERFLREARAAAQISHDNVVTVFEADEWDGVPYIAMPVLQGCPLDQYLKTKGAPALAHVGRIGREVALGLAAAHARGLVHRDIKPSNLWLEAPNGRVKVLDFGLAKPVGSASELTESGAVVGTPAYMSPEQARGLKVDARSDLFSLGAVLYRLCTGQNPFTGDHVVAVLAALVSESPVPVRELNPNVPAALADLIHRLLAKDPAQRPQTASEVAKRLRAITERHTAPPGAGPPAGNESDSLPVVVRAIPNSAPAPPHRAVPTLENERPDSGVTEPVSAEKRPKPVAQAPLGKWWLLAVVSVVLLLAVVLGVLSQTGTKQGPDTKGAAAGAGDTAKAGALVLPPTYENSIGMKFVRVPKGMGWLGGGANKAGETKVVIGHDFYLGRFEVTQEEWAAVTGGLTPSHFKRGHEAVQDISDADLNRFPVEYVSWDDCQVFIERLNKMEPGTGWVYRLPTEAEWEYACRGGPVDDLSSGFDFYLAKPTNVLQLKQANFGWNEGLNRTCKVGSYEPNPLGLHDMHGNVWEWCADAVPGADGAAHRALRGGSCFFISGHCRAASRDTHLPSERHTVLGLRLARVPSAPAGE